jgi:hypothetical protein
MAAQVTIQPIRKGREDAKKPLLVGIVHWWPAPAGVGRVLDLCRLGLLHLCK